MCPVRALPLDDGLQVDESEVLAFCFPDSGKLFELNKAAGRRADGGTRGAKDPTAKWLSEVVEKKDLKSFASDIGLRLRRAAPTELKRLTSLNPLTEDALVEVTGFAMIEGIDFSAVKPETVAGGFLAGVKQKLVEKGVDGVFKRLGQARPESHAQTLLKQSPWPAHTHFHSHRYTRYCTRFCPRRHLMTGDAGDARVCQLALRRAA